MNEKAKLDFIVKVPPEKLVIGICGNCGNEIERMKWGSYGYVQHVKRKMKECHSRCGKCGILFDHVKMGEQKPTPKWVKVGTNEYEAKVADGDFLVWKWGCVWKSRYRAKGAKEPAWVETSFCVECAKGICEKNKKWVV
jgi:hypothetical protein